MFTDGSDSAAQFFASDAVKKFSPLSRLTAQSARFGLGEMMIFNPVATKREYVYGKDKRTSLYFQCVLVSTADPSQYVLGDSRGKAMTTQKLTYSESTLKPGLALLKQRKASKV